MQRNKVNEIGGLHLGMYIYTIGSMCGMRRCQYFRNSEMHPNSTQCILFKQNLQMSKQGVHRCPSCLDGVVELVIEEE